MRRLGGRRFGLTALARKIDGLLMERSPIGERAMTSAEWAVEEIERLREALMSIEALPSTPAQIDIAKYIARRALEGK